MNFAKMRVALAQNGILIALVGLIVVFTLMNTRFLSIQNIQNLVQQSVELGFIALPLALLIMARGIDLSVGSVASLGAMSAAITMTSTGNWVLGVLVGLVVGAVAGAVNGYLAAYLGLNPIIVTLGALSVWSGAALMLSDGKTITGLPDAFKALGQFSVGPIRIQVLLLAVVVVAAWILLNKTPFGRQLLAVGGNDRAAHLMGIPVARTRMLLYIVTSVFAAFAGIMLVSKLQAAGPTLGTGLEIQALTVVLLGGVAMTGGAGRISSVVAGLFFVAVMRNGLVIMGVSQFVQVIITGAVLLVAIAVDGTIQRMVRRTWTKVAEDQSETNTAGREEKTSIPA